MAEILDTDPVGTGLPSAPHDLPANRLAGLVEQTSGRVFFGDNMYFISGGYRVGGLKTDTVGTEVEHGGADKFFGIVKDIHDRSQKRHPLAMPSFFVLHHGVDILCRSRALGQLVPHPLGAAIRLGVSSEGIK